MRFGLFLLLIIIPLAISGIIEEDSSLPAAEWERLTLQEAAVRADIPVKKLKNYLELNLLTDNSLTMAELKIAQADYQQIIENYNRNRKSFYIGIVLVGMSIVFLSLALVGFIINHIRILHFFDNFRRNKITSAPVTISTTARGINLSQNDIVALITAIYLHEQEAEEQDRLLLTWKRASISMWKAAGKIRMPNLLFSHDRTRS